MNKVYSFMAVGLALTGVIAHLTSKMAFDFSTNTMTSFGAAIYASPLAFIIMLSPLAFILALNFGIAKMKESTVQILFWAFAGVMGLSLSSIFIQYTGESVARVFFISAGAFGGLSLYGYTTKKRSFWVGIILIYWSYRNIACINCKHISRQYWFAICNLCNWCFSFCWPHSI